MVSTDVRKLFMNISGNGASWARRRWSTCRAMTSRNDQPLRTQSRLFARSMPMDVPRPPLSLITAVRRSAADASSSSMSTSASDSMSSGSIEDSGMMPVSPCSSRR